MTLKEYLETKSLTQQEFCDLITKAYPDMPLKQPSLNEWLRKGSCPPARAYQIAYVTKGKVRPVDACPKYFRKPNAQK